MQMQESYYIIFVWKIIQGLVKGYEENFTENPRRGRLAVVHPSAPRDAPAAVRNAMEASFQVKGSMLVT